MPGALAIALILLLAYLLGSLSGSLLLGRLRGVDVRTLGSGNAGGTNAFRTQGWRFALGVVVVDVGKGMLAAWLALQVAPAWAYAAAAAAVIGHVWPLWHGFRGGKGAATAVGGLLVLWPMAVLPLLLVWVLVLISTGYVGLATVLAACTLPLLAWGDGAGPARWAFALAVPLYLVFTHRGNLQRLRAGTESRFERARLLHRWWTKA
ncbi:MAG: glycerol-3-phosphate 1-O-acyltransferase PlsY [Xanthomonadaceae bacterium]|nr:glycerol-3-phosphate 1-O-acyltransferase PlsY [Xanthomonadaceae bacterium]